MRVTTFCLLNGLTLVALGLWMDGVETDDGGDGRLAIVWILVFGARLGANDFATFRVNSAYGAVVGAAGLRVALFGGPPSSAVSSFTCTTSENWTRECARERCCSGIR